jgi:DNA-directed RNA polymerase specialized sigma24 family protein
MSGAEAAVRLQPTAARRIWSGHVSELEVGVDPDDDAQATRELIDRCLAGVDAALRQFQALYGELIYAYPLRVYRAGAESAGDFYVYAFEHGRIFRRARTYAGRAPFRAFLLTVVLDHLFIDWRRATHEIETLTLDDSDGVSEEGGGAAAVVGPPTLPTLLEGLERSKAVVMKLLCVEDYELDAADYSHIVHVSGQTLPTVVAAVEDLRATVREREVGLQRVADSLDAVQAWIEVYERRRQRLVEDLGGLPPGSVAAARVREACERLEAQLRRRQHQRAKLRAERLRRKTTAPYKDIAAILHTSVGNVASQIARVREELARKTRRGIKKEDECI